MDRNERFLVHIEAMDTYLDSHVDPQYQDQPLAQDWARVAKITEEAGEAVDALIGMSGQNPRKGVYATGEDLDDELSDAALTAIYALQHFTKDRELTMELLQTRAAYHCSRVGI